MNRMQEKGGPVKVNGFRGSARLPRFLRVHCYNCHRLVHLTRAFSKWGFYYGKGHCGVRFEAKLDFRNDNLPSADGFQFDKSDLEETMGSTGGCRLKSKNRANVKITTDPNRG